MRYGDNRTIHHSGKVSVEVGPEGRVVSVWFRCHPLAFTADTVGIERAEDMDRMYEKEPAPIRAIDFDEEPFMPAPGALLDCLVCAREKPWGIYDEPTGAAVCVECRDKARA
jgi:hypothetical protein